MDLVDRIAALATRVAAEFNSVRGEMALISGGGGSQIFIQQTRPTEPGPWTWWQTDENGDIIDLTINDGA